MPAITYTNVLAKRGKNFAQRQPGVVLVFCIIGALALLIISLIVVKKRAEANKRKEDAAHRKMNATPKMQTAPAV